MLLMAQKSIRLSRPAMIGHSVSRTDDQWVIDTESHAMPRCPSCGTVSERQHSWYQWSLRDLPMQGVPVVIRLQVRKWRCEAPTCERSIFAERLPGLSSPHAQQRDAIADILAVMGHGVTLYLNPARRQLALRGAGESGGWRRALHVWSGMPHVFYGLVGMLKAASDALDIAGAFFRQLSQAGPSPLPNGH
jgi:hypothetical protein